MIDPAIISTVFILIFLAELGDKTQIAIVSLTMEYRSLRSIFLGAVSALITINIVSVLMGTSLSLLLPFDLIGKVAGSIFILFGALKIIQGRGSQDLRRLQGSDGNTLGRTFLLIGLAELGDKTQLATLALAAQYSSPLSVLLGAALAFTSITALGVAIGDKLSRLTTATLIERYSGIIFIIIGLWMIL